MTKEQILQKHFTAEFGHDGHGEFMQYILDAMEEYAQQQVKNLNMTAVIKSVCQCCGKRTIDYFNTKCKSCGTEHAYKQTVL